MTSESEPREFMGSQELCRVSACRESELIKCPLIRSQGLCRVTACEELKFAESQTVRGQSSLPRMHHLMENRVNHFEESGGRQDNKMSHS